MVSRYTSALGYAVRGGSAADMYERLQAAGYLLETADRESVTALIKRTIHEYQPGGFDGGPEIACALRKSPFLSIRGREAAGHTVTWDGKEIETPPAPDVFIGEAAMPMHTRIVVTRYG